MGSSHGKNLRPLSFTTRQEVYSSFQLWMKAVSVRMLGFLVWKCCQRVNRAMQDPSTTWFHPRRPALMGHQHPGGAWSFCPAVCSWEPKLKQPRVHNGHQEPNSTEIGCCWKPMWVRHVGDSGAQPIEPQSRMLSQSLDWLVFLTGQSSINPDQA